MTRKEMEQIADLVVERIRSMEREHESPISLSEVVRFYGWSKSFVYKHAMALGGFHVGKKLFFVRSTIDQVIREQKI